MLDPTTVGANLTPAQQEETVADLAFFLDEFGSTRAVCAKLQEQERDIQQLQQQVWRLLGRRSDRNAQQQHETAANYSKMGVDVIKNWEKDPELVDDIMESVDFFLRAYGSTRAVRNRLQSQSHLIAGLKCTVNWFLQLHKNGGTPSLSTEAAPKFVGVRLPSAVKAAQENEEPTRTQQLDADEGNNVTSNSSKDGAEVIRIAGGRGANDKRDGGSLQSAASMSLVSAKFLNSAAVTDYVKALKCVDEACAKATSSKFKNPSDAAGSFRQINEIEPISKENASSANSEKANTGVYSTDRKPASKFKFTCSHAGCSSRVQVNGLCYRHGGFYICRAGGCERKALTRYLCRQHGGGTVCHVLDCNKLTVSGGKGFCATHAREKGVMIKYGCKVAGCNMTRVKQGYCHRHNIENQVEQPQTQTLGIPSNPANETSSSLSAGIPRGHHVTCRIMGCMKWVRRDGDPSEYCAMHRPMSTSQEPAGVSVLHTENAHTLNTTAAKRGMCQESGCPNIAKNYGPRKGYCFRHGGGLTCSEPSCTKQRQRNGLCAAHGGYYECKVEWCKKRVAARGFCRGHCQESVVSRVDPLYRGL